jgi:type I restriction enzyme S subunit
MVQASPGRVVRLAEVVRARPGNSKLIKGKLPSQPGPGLYPAFSASGQDTYTPAAEHIGNAVVVSAVGARCGKCFLASGQWSAIANTHVLLPDESEIDVRFLWYRVNDERFWIRGGSAQPFVRVRESLERELLLPPLQEQKQIVAELEKQFSRLDEAVANLKRVITRLAGYRERALDDAFASEPSAALGELISEGPQNGLYLPKGAYGSGTPIVRIDDYQTNWIRPVAELRRVRAGESQLSTWALQPGDLLVNRVNSMSHLGKCVVIPTALSGALFESNMMRFRLVPGVLPRYVELYLGSRIGKRRLTANAKWAVNQASINQKDVQATELPLPSLERQASIVAEVDLRLSIVREVEGEVDANLARSVGLRRSVLARAFALSGALKALA